MKEGPPAGSQGVVGIAAVTAPVGFAALPEDDMINLPEDFQRFPFLLQISGGCHDELIKTYFDADRASLEAQKSHRRWVIFAALFATLAVVLAILQLSRSAEPETLRPTGYLQTMPIPAFELVAVLFAWLSFHQGDKTRKKWLRERHKAERCRFLKFSSLILPDMYVQGAQLSQVYSARITPLMNRVKNISYKDLEEWLANDTLPTPPGRILPRSLEELTQLRDYYRDRRLAFQIRYFQRQVERDTRSDDWWRSILPFFFLGSVVFVGLHVIIHLADYERGHLRWLEELALVLAALLPVFGSGIRIWRSAREATRNINRFRAKRIALSNISDRFKGGAAVKDNAEAEDVLRDLWCAEEIMESEHREWLRLMMEAEWVG